MPGQEHSVRTIRASVIFMEVRQFVNSVHHDNHHEKVVLLRVHMKMQAPKCLTAYPRRLLSFILNGNKDQAPSCAMHICPHPQDTEGSMAVRLGPFHSSPDRLPRCLFFEVFLSASFTATSAT